MVYEKTDGQEFLVVWHLVYLLNTLNLQTTPVALDDILGGLQVISSVEGNDTNNRLMVSEGGPNKTQTYVNGLLIAHPNTLRMNNTG